MATSNPNPNAGRINNFVDRISSLDNRANSPMVCPDCSGTFFVKVAAEQFSDGGYGTVQFRSLSSSPQAAYVCLCGRVMETKEKVGRGMEGEHSKFVTSVANAIAAQDRKKTNLQELTNNVASLSEFEDLRAQVKWLEESVTVLSSGSETPVEDEDKEPDLTGEPGEPEIPVTSETAVQVEDIPEPVLVPVAELIPPPKTILEQPAPLRTGRLARNK